jgi:hypothetical protein
VVNSIPDTFEDCPRCKAAWQDEPRLVRLVYGARKISSGAIHYGKVCPECHWNQAMKKEAFRQIVGDMGFPRFDDEPYSLCEKCGAPYAEIHHWAPRYIFGIDADKWPTSALCRSCHEEWHRKVTPLMNLPY